MTRSPVSGRWPERFPGREDLVDLGRIVLLHERFADLRIREQLGQLRKDLEVLLGRVLRHQEEHDQADGLAVRSVERDGGREPDDRAQGLLQALDAAMGNRDAVAEARRAQPFAREQGVGDPAALDSVAVLEEEAGLFEESLLARYRDVDQ